MSKQHSSFSDLSDDDFTPEELYIIYGIPHPQTITYETNADADSHKKLINNY